MAWTLKNGFWTRPIVDEPPTAGRRPWPKFQHYPEFFIFDPVAVFASYGDVMERGIITGIHIGDGRAGITYEVETWSGKRKRLDPEDLTLVTQKGVEDATAPPDLDI